VRTILYTGQYHLTEWKYTIYAGVTMCEAVRKSMNNASVLCVCYCVFNG
jgi:hypothetical protein